MKKGGNGKDRTISASIQNASSNVDVSSEEEISPVTKSNSSPKTPMLSRNLISSARLSQMRGAHRMLLRMCLLLLLLVQLEVWWKRSACNGRMFKQCLVTERIWRYIAC
ncbi:uncharacterized protein LOC135225007 isoform X2 [Macrobrachium nipponense]|uniref:uncharacterized protein LOC135225007 isoform X2 n=1 Tax=Macrobrachium nipponense TaxID=159736 RepID=UPI0030C83543